MPQNNFLIFNEANNSDITMSDENYASYPQRLNGLTLGMADLVVHNKMYLQWSIMSKAIADMIYDKGYDALDSDLTDLKNNLKSAVKDLAEDKLGTRITTLETWKDDITATPTEINVLDGITASTAELNILHGVTADTAELNILDGITADTAELNTLDGITASTAELNILDGVTASTSELNYSTGLTGNIQQQINAITGVMSSPFPTWNASTPYAVGDICIASNFNSYKYLECVVAGTTDTTMPANANVGQLVTDNEVKWLVCDWRDSAPVGAFRSDMVQRAGWLKANGATVNRADYPRLWAYAVANNLVDSSYTPSLPLSSYPGFFGEGDGITTFTLPNYEDYFIRYSFTRVSGHKQNSQMASHSHSCIKQDTSHTHTLGNQSANHKHKYTYDSVAGSTGTNGSIVSGSGYGRTVGKEATTGNQDTSHTHSISNQTANHQHTIGSTGSGSNTYPDNIAMQMFIKY